MPKLLIAAAALALAVPDFDQEENAISMEEVPEVARTAAEENDMGVSFKTVRMGLDVGSDVLEFSGAEGAA